MQNKFVGDVADFGKYGLLRFLTGLTAGDGLEHLPLGVVWYLRANEEHSGGGKHTSYLFPTDKDDRAEYRDCDPGLWNWLRALVKNADDLKRCVCCVERTGVLPEGTKFFDWQLVNLPHLDKGVKAKARDFWLRRATLTVNDAKLVYFDPDNNLAVNDDDKYAPIGTKYAYIDDLLAFWACGQSLAFYHQRMALTEEKICETANRVEAALGVRPICLWLRRGGTPAFFVVPQPEHKDTIEDRIGRFMAGPWGINEHFRRV